MQSTVRNVLATALDSPERRRLLHVLREAGDPPTAHELAAELGLHVTTIRFHLEALEREGLVVRGRRSGIGRGRPPLTYRARGLDAAAVDRGMISALAEALAGEGTPATRAEAAGRQWARELQPHIAGEGREAVAQVLDLVGFAPAPTDEGFTLHACPFLDAARRHREVVCGVHLGLLHGAAPRAGIELMPLVDGQQCLVRVRNHD